MNNTKIINNLPSKRQLKKMRKKGHEILKASRSKKNYNKSKSKKYYINDDKLTYSDNINYFLSELYIRKLPSKDIKKYVSKHRAGIVSAANLLPEIRHNFTNYDNIIEEINKEFNPKTAREIHSIIKKECNELIIDTYPEFIFKIYVRSATAEENKSVNDYIDSISKETSINFYDELQNKRNY